MSTQTITLKPKRKSVKHVLHKTLVSLNYLCISWTAFCLSASATIAYIYFTH